MTLVKFKNGTDRTMGRTFSPLFNDMFDNFLGGRLMPELSASVPPVNIHETAEAFKIELAAPGMQKDAFSIQVDKDVLTISSEKKEEQTAESPKYTRKEFSYTSFSRSFNLPETADKEQIAAEYTNGVLTLTIRKKEDVADAVKVIKVS